MQTFTPAQTIITTDNISQRATQFQAAWDSWDEETRNFWLEEAVSQAKLRMSMITKARRSTAPITAENWAMIVMSAAYEAPHRARRAKQARRVKAIPPASTDEVWRYIVEHGPITWYGSGPATLGGGFADVLAHGDNTSDDVIAIAKAMADLVEGSVEDGRLTTRNLTLGRPTQRQNGDWQGMTHNIIIRLHPAHPDNFPYLRPA